MNKPKDRIEELFQGHMDDFEKMPDDSLWVDIEANLPPLERPVYRLRRWALVASLLLFSLIGYMTYESLGIGQKADVVGLKENMSNNNKSQEANNKKDTKTASEANEINLTEEESAKEAMVPNKAKTNKIAIAEKTNLKDKVLDGNKSAKRQENSASIEPNSVTKSGELLIQKENQIAAVASEENQVKNNQAIGRVEENSNQQNTIAKTDDIERLSDVGYLSNRGNILTNEIPLNTHITYEAEHQPVEKKESFFKVPSEVYVSITPSLNYYRVFSNTVINQFNGANNGGRVGWALQAGAVYPLKFKRFNYRVGLSYFSAQSNFRYNVVNRTQMPVRLNDNTFEYVNVESLQSESKKWQVLEIQNDLMYKVRPMQDFILGFKAGSSFTEKPVFDAYTGYRFSKQVSNRQILWIEAAYAYAINAQKSSTHTFSYHMDKYSLRVGVNFR